MWPNSVCVHTYCLVTIAVFLAVWSQVSSEETIETQNTPQLPQAPAASATDKDNQRVAAGSERDVTKPQAEAIKKGDVAGGETESKQSIETRADAKKSGEVEQGSSKSAEIQEDKTKEEVKKVEEEKNQQNQVELAKEKNEGGGDVGSLRPVEVNSALSPDEAPSTTMSFVGYFITGVVLIAVAYVAYNNRKKILGLIVEGRRQAKRSSEYKRLQTQEGDEHTTQQASSA